MAKRMQHASSRSGRTGLLLIGTMAILAAFVPVAVAGNQKPQKPSTAAPRYKRSKINKILDLPKDTDVQVPGHIAKMRERVNSALHHSVPKGTTVPTTTTPPESPENRKMAFQDVFSDPAQLDRAQNVKDAIHAGEAKEQAEVHRAAAAAGEAAAGQDGAVDFSNPFKGKTVLEVRESEVQARQQGEDQERLKAQEEQLEEQEEQLEELTRELAQRDEELRLERLRTTLAQRDAEIARLTSAIVAKDAELAGLRAKDGSVKDELVTTSRQQLKDETELISPYQPTTLQQQRLSEEHASFEHKALTQVSQEIKRLSKEHASLEHNATARPWACYDAKGEEVAGSICCTNGKAGTDHAACECMSGYDACDKIVIAGVARADCDIAEAPCKNAKFSGVFS